MDEKVVPLHAVPRRAPRAVFTVQIEVYDNDTAEVRFTDAHQLSDAVAGDLLLRATYNWHRRKLAGFAVASLTAGETNTYYEGSLPWDRVNRRRLRRRLDDVYHLITGRPRGLVQWLRTRSPK